MKYIVGIDLGTTNSALAYIASLVDDGAEKPLLAEVMPVPQVVAAGSVLDRSTLPSFMYLAAEGELPAGALDLPWAEGRDFAVGAALRYHVTATATSRLPAMLSVGMRIVFRWE